METSLPFSYGFSRADKQIGKLEMAIKTAAMVAFLPLEMDFHPYGWAAAGP
jgi:hypothetical protein